MYHKTADFTNNSNGSICNLGVVQPCSLRVGKGRHRSHLSEGSSFVQDEVCSLLYISAVSIKSLGSLATDQVFDRLDYEIAAISGTQTSMMAAIFPIPNANV